MTDISTRKAEILFQRTGHIFSPIGTRFRTHLMEYDRIDLLHALPGCSAREDTHKGMSLQEQMVARGLIAEEEALCPCVIWLVDCCRSGRASNWRGCGAGLPGFWRRLR